MEVRDAQRDVRTVYLGTFPGLIVSSVIWFVAAAAGTWSRPGVAVWALVLGGTFIYPLSTTLLRLMGRSPSLRRDNPFGQLAMQIAFTIPAAYPLIGAAAIHTVNWFFPAFLVVVGAHYLPFIFLYGMWQFGVLAGALIVTGTACGIYAPDQFALGGWIGGVVLLAAAFPFRVIALRSASV